MAKGGTPTPSSIPTANRNERNRKQKLVQRDGWFSRVGYVMDKSAPAHITPQPVGTAVLEAAHIIPFSASKNQPLRSLLSVFAGQDMEMLLTGENINDASNALLLSPTTHRSLGDFEFGLECRDKKYFMRRLLEARLLHTEVKSHMDGEEIYFGQGSNPDIVKPSPLLCNLHLAVGLVLRNSGVAEMISQILQDEDLFNDGNVEGDYWFQVSASLLERKLRAAQVSDESVIDDKMNADTNGNLSVHSHHTLCI
ncbi:hypothetical protein LIPSTDRAFT_7488 [Lipomyces starkeyi NRRL Y-11557]|uniref:HNH nuclease domain-containing protein n=1 Tax=Lipomyces starkeyi NRRL Y-11557 TaxID=675824 RepID=A0A1E3PTH8_LIPST|nr:hypothetical protein LIPSTDRAFT_7488 [Lipomyces starkeyi NRRL Y-11557]